MKKLGTTALFLHDNKHCIDKKLLAVILGMVCILVLGFSAVSAAYTTSLDTHHDFSLGKVDFELSEEPSENKTTIEVEGAQDDALEAAAATNLYDENDLSKLVWQQKIQHCVTIKNTCEPCWIRVKSDLSKEDKNFGTLSWPMQDGSALNSDEWAFSEDGYFYRLSPLQTGDTAKFIETLQPPLLEKETGEIINTLQQESQQVSMHYDTNSEYTRSSGGDITSFITVDAVQSENFEPDFDSSTPWGNMEIKSSKTLGEAEYGATKSETDSIYTVYLKGDDDPYIEAEGNLFEPLTPAMPGGVFQTSLLACNQSSAKVRLYLEVAPPANYDTTLFDSCALKILSTDGLGEMYNGSVSGNDANANKSIAIDGDVNENINESEESGTSSKILVGELEPNEDKLVDVEIDVPSSLDNEYALEQVSADLKFTAEKMETDEAGKLVKAGDTVKIATILVIAVCAIIATLIIRRRKATWLPLTR